jgi:hypothetical protein
MNKEEGYLKLQNSMSGILRASETSEINDF